MQRLGVRLIERRDPEDAIVLGDAMQQEGIDGLITGRSRPVRIRVVSMAYGADSYARITTRDEQRVIAHTRTTSPRNDQREFAVQGYEVIYNVDRFAAKPDEERWGKIWTMWVTPRRTMYRALVDTQLLPSTIHFHELQWQNVFHLPADIALAYRLHLVRAPPRRKKAIDAYLFSIVRHDEDNPRTWERHFDEPPRSR